MPAWAGGWVARCVWARAFAAQALLNLVALQLPIRVGFVAPVVLAAWMPAVVISAAAIWMQTRTNFPLRLRLIGGVLIAMGLCLLTFIHASAIMFQPECFLGCLASGRGRAVDPDGVPARLAGPAAQPGGRAALVAAWPAGAGHQCPVQRRSGVHGVGHAGAGRGPCA